MGALAELLAAFALLTRLRIPDLAASRPPIGRIVWAFPLAGAAMGAAGGAIYAACALLRMPHAVGAVWALAAMMLASGALHEDGLADMADGFGGGRTRARKLEIMRDSRIGSYGAIALVLSLAARAAAIAAIGAPRHVLAAMVAAAALGRGAMVVPPLLLGPARSDGLAAALRDMPRWRAALALVLAALPAALLLPGGLALRAILGALAAALATSLLAARQIGGYTGDVLGADAVLAECAAIGLIAAW